MTLAKLGQLIPREFLGPSLTASQVPQKLRLLGARRLNSSALAHQADQGLEMFLEQMEQREPYQWISWDDHGLDMILICIYLHDNKEYDKKHMLYDFVKRLRAFHTQLSG